MIFAVLETLSLSETVVTLKDHVDGYIAENIMCEHTCYVSFHLTIALLRNNHRNYLNLKPTLIQKYPVWFRLDPQ
eukprot:UN02868